MAVGSKGGNQDPNSRMKERVGERWDSDKVGLKMAVGVAVY